MAFNQGCRALLPTAPVDVRFFLYQLSAMTDQLKACGQGTTFLELSTDTLASFSVHAPALEEQRRIADFLDAETARIDRIISARAQQRASLEERAYADVSETLIPGITREACGSWPWFWLPDLDSDRPLVRLGYVCQLQSGITVDGSRNASGDWITRPYLRVANVQAGYLDLSSVTEVTVPKAMAARSTLRPGDVLMTEGGDLDKLGRGTVWRGEIPNCLHQNHVFALRPDPDRLDADYLALMTQTVHGRCYFESTGSKTTNLASTNSSKIMGFPIPLPALSRQRELVREVRKRLDVLARAKTKVDRQLELLTERRQALITAAVTGQIDVTASERSIEG
jgi:type I restriction enzyme S subunit